MIQLRMYIVDNREMCVRIGSNQQHGENKLES